MSDDKKMLNEIFDNVVGHISVGEAEQLFNFARQITLRGAIVEIGSYQGKSTIFLAKGSKAGINNKVFAVDPHEEFVGVFGGKFGPQDRDKFLSNIERYGVADIVELVSKRSEDAAKGWNKPVSFIWIDGDHSYEAVLRDFTLWEPFLVTGGLIAFHDVTEGSGPKEIMEKMVVKNNRFANIGFVESIGYAIKK